MTVDRSLMTELARDSAKPVEMTDTPRTDCVGRITAYLTHGGLWNPELAVHEAVRQLFMDCREELTTAEAELAEARKGRDEATVVPRGDPMENWLMKTSLEWLEQAEHGGDNERCKMIAGMLRVLWRNAPPAAATQGEAADALSRQQPSKEAIEVATKYMDNGPYGAWAVMASEILRLAGEGKP